MTWNYAELIISEDKLFDVLLFADVIAVNLKMFYLLSESNHIWFTNRLSQYLFK